ncbi:hypothetical protein U1Q18_045511, partial [Sarracenia purpurea var. burkii]
SSCWEELPLSLWNLPKRTSNLENEVGKIRQYWVVVERVPCIPIGACQLDWLLAGRLTVADKVGLIVMWRWLLTRRLFGLECVGTTSLACSGWLNVLDRGGFYYFDFPSKEEAARVLEGQWVFGGLMCYNPGSALVVVDFVGEEQEIL